MEWKVNSRLPRQYERRQRGKEMNQEQMTSKQQKGGEA